MNKFLCLAVAILLSHGGVFAKTTVFTNANVVDVVTGEIKHGQSIQITDKRIVSVSAKVSYDKNAEVIDLKGAFVMPGMWDAHLHSGGDLVQMRDTLNPILLKHGITQFRDMGLSLDSTKAITKAQETGDLPSSPLIYKSGPLVDGFEKQWYKHLQYVISDSNLVPKALDELQAAGVDYVKIYQDMSEPVYIAIAQEAKARGLSIAGHLPSNLTIELLAEYNQVSIEHLDITALMSCSPDGKRYFDESIQAKFGQGYDAYYKVFIAFMDSIDWTKCDKQLKAFGKSGGAWTPTLIMETFDRSVVDASALELLNEQGNTWCEMQLTGIENANDDLRQTFLKRIRFAMDKIREAGIVILAGTDSPNYCNVPGQSLLWELKQLAAFGLTNLEVLQAATINPSKAFGFTNRGQVNVGYTGDIVVLKDNPLNDLNALRTIQGVFTSGSWQTLK